jgi:hypothetical protein
VYYPDPFKPLPDPPGTYRRDLMPTAPRSKHRLLACALLALAAMLAIPSAASASKTQLSLFQDDAELTQGQGA